MKPDRSNINPPKYGERLLSKVLKDDLLEEVLGDLEEKFHKTAHKYSKIKARRNYWYQVINYLRPFAIKHFRSKSFNNITMVKHNFKISFRQLLRNKAFSLINIGGLAFGMVVTILISLWVQDELNFNKYFEDYDQIVQVMRKDLYDGETAINSANVSGLGALIRSNNWDQVEDVLMVRWRNQDFVLSYEENKFRQVGIFLEQNGPEFLGLKMIRGDLSALKERRSIILSQSLAKKLFGDMDPMNKMVSINAQAELLVTGVYEDLPKNTKFAEATYFSRVEHITGDENMNIWSNYNMAVYLKVAPGVDYEELSNLITEQSKPNFNKFAIEAQLSFLLHPMSDWHLKSEWDENGNPVLSQSMKFVWMYGAIGVFVLLLACVNFMNLSTAQSEKRAKEVGIRKTLGSVKKQLVFQFYIESFLYSFFAFIISQGLLYLFLPWFNATAEKDIVLPWSHLEFWFISLAFVLMTSILAGSYPALFLSSFKPISTLKGKINTGKWASIPRRALVVFQFTISITLIIGSITVNEQIQYAKNRPVGYSPKGMLTIRPATPNFQEKRTILADELMKTGMVAATGASNYPVTNARGWNGGFTWEGMDPTFDKSFNTIKISHGYADAVQMKFISGRNFDPTLSTDKNAIIINRSAMEEMQLENPVGTVVRWAPTWKDPESYTIIGVVEDMIKESPFAHTYLSVMFLEEKSMDWFFIRLNPNQSASIAIPVIQDTFDAIFPEAPFDYHFADDDYAQKFMAEIRIGELANFFTLLAILISVLGLFGLVSYMTERRTKEIGIRKVLGASIASIWQLISKEFVILIGISAMIAIPIAYRIMNGWLNSYEVKTNISAKVILLSVIGGLSITIITVSFQAIKAALANPVNALRSE